MINGRLAKRANTPVSAIRQIFARLPAIIESRQKNGQSPLINLSIGQPHIQPNQEVMQQVAQMQSNKSSQGYTSAQGEPATLSAIARLYKHYYPNVDYSTAETMVTIGGSGALSNVFSILVENKDDVILTFEPYFGAYSGQIQEWGGTLQKIPTRKNNFRPTAQGLQDALKQYPNTKALVMNYPNNPSGVSLTRDEVIALATVLENYPDIFIIIDDVYRDFNYQEHITILDVAPHFKSRCMVINSGAKGLLGAPGERIGMIAADAEIIKSMLPRQTNGLSSVPYRTQAALRFAAESHMNNPQNNWLMNAKKEYSTNVFAAAAAFKEQGFTMQSQIGGAFYLLICAKHLIGLVDPESSKVIENDLDIVNYFIQSAGVAAVPGSGFGIDTIEGFLRILCANEKDLLLEAAKRMGDASKLLLAPLNKQIPSPRMSNLAQHSLIKEMNKSADNHAVTVTVTRPSNQSN